MYRFGFDKLLCDRDWFIRFHIMNFKVMRETYEKLKPKISNYRDCKISAIKDFGKFFWMHCLQKISIQHVVQWKSLYIFAIMN